MNMIRHNDERIEIITLIVEMAEGVSDDACQGRLAENTGAVTRIEPLTYPGTESPMIFGFGLSVPRLGVVTHPSVFFILPFSEFCGRQSISQTVSDKVEDVTLLPMRKMVLVDIDVGIRV